jgi:predicted amidohydrolase YtcJ
MSSTERWLLRDVSVDGARLDCLIDGGRIAALAPDLRTPDARVLDAGGGELLPGLADPHIHLMAAAAAEESLDLAGGGDLTQLAGRPEADWIRVIGAGVELTRTDIDRVEATRPVRVQHRSGALWTLNTPAVELLAPALTGSERASGQLWRADERLRRALGPGPGPDLARLGQRLATWGVTHVVDATPTGDRGVFAALPQHVVTMDAAGRGPRKLVLTDHELPELDDVIRRIGRTHAVGRPIAVHAVSAVALALAVAAIEAAGPMPGDRIEHAAVCDDAAADRIAELGLTVVTQPSIFARHGATFWHESPPAERAWLWRYGSLLRRGIRVAMSSDAPYGDANPWSGVRAATTRYGPERVCATTALGSLFAEPDEPAGPARRVQLGAAADLCLLRGTSHEALRTEVAPVLATFVAGRAVHLADPAAPGRRDRLDGT